MPLFPSSPISCQRGFTLVELMIAISIVTLITGLVMVRHSSFNSAVLEENQAYEVAFDIRQTQQRAVSPQVGVTGDIRGGYGIRFVDNRTYEVFQETNESRVVVDQRQLDNRFQMEVSDSADSDVNTIFFQRPDFDARFLRNNGDEVLGADSMTINISMVDSGGINTGGRDIKVTSSGQISIRRASEE